MNNKISSKPKTSEKDHVLSNVFSPEELKESKLKGRTLFKIIKIKNENKKKLIFNKIFNSILLVTLVPETFKLSISLGTRKSVSEKKKIVKKEIKNKKK